MIELFFKMELSELFKATIQIPCFCLVVGRNVIYRLSSTTLQPNRSVETWWTDDKLNFNSTEISLREREFVFWVLLSCSFVELQSRGFLVLTFLNPFFFFKGTSVKILGDGKTFLFSMKVWKPTEMASLIYLKY